MNVMKRAWEIARKGQKQFGGKVKEYFAQALVIAWAELKSRKAQLKAIQEKSLVIFGEYLGNLVKNGMELVSKEETAAVLSYVEKGYTKQLTITMEMSDFDVFAKVVRGKQINYFNLGKAM